ncbi:hypothetical protein HYQ46_010350 [Verticillium longisporum]|nr:hypothetical protein HYQ46_010350 [Verticillium longisporum]
MYHKSRGLLKERQGCQQKEVWEEEKGRPGKETRKTIGQASQPERWMVKLRTTETRSSTLRFGGGARARIRRRQIAQIARQPRGARWAEASLPAEVQDVRAREVTTYPTSHYENSIPRQVIMCICINIARLSSHTSQ